MRLLTKTSLFYLASIIPILIVSGYVCYVIVTAEAKESSDELLSNFKGQVEKYVQQNNTVSIKAITQSKEAQITKIKARQHGDFYSDTLILDKAENELAINRMLTSYIKSGSTNYRIKIWRNTLEVDELLQGILTSLLFMLILFLIANFIINAWISRVLWKPFRKTITDVKNFSSNTTTAPIAGQTSIREFRDLNESVYVMMNKMIADYHSQKKFTENASHEIQTPLAVIKAKIDILIQSQNLKEADMEVIIGIDDACSKLIRINKSLLLLTKIENLQFTEKEKVSAIRLIDNSLLLFAEGIKALGIKVVMNPEEDWELLMNADLGMILVNNLIQNAVRHNSMGGSIIVTIKKESLVIQNSGGGMPLDSNDFVSRFQKRSSSEHSVGLGLAIINEIALTCGLLFQYQYCSEKHCFMLIKG